MPALGHTISEAVVVHARSTLPDGEFRRAFLNRRTKAENRVIPVNEWNAVCSEDAAPQGQLVFSLDVNPERTAAAIVAASAAGPAAELIEHAPGTGWVVERAKTLSARWNNPLWVVDSTGPAGSLVPEMVEERLRVHPATARELIQACGQFYDGVMDNKIQIRRHAKLNDAAAGATKRTVGDAWAWTRRTASADISPLVAATLALWGAANAKQVDVAASIW